MLEREWIVRAAEAAASAAPGGTSRDGFNERWRELIPQINSAQSAAVRAARALGVSRTIIDRLPAGKSVAP